MGYTLNVLTGQFDIVGGGITIGQTIGGASPNSVLIVNTAGQLDDVGSLTDGQLVIGSTGADPVAAALTGTANQIVVTNGAGSITLSLPQNIAISSTPTFNGLLLEETGAGSDTITLQAPASIAASYTLTLPIDDGASGEVLQTDGSGVLSWIANGSITVGTIDSQAKTADGGVIAGSSLYFQTANASFPGLVSTAAQTFAGDKTFQDQINADGGIDLSASGTLSIGTSVNATVINIGNSGATVNIQGTTLYENVTQLQVADPLIALNVGGGVGSAQDSGIELEENAVITGYVKTSLDRNSWLMKAPNTAGEITLTPGASGFIINQGSHDPVTVSDTNTIDLTLSTQLLSADVRYQDSTSINLSDDASGLKADLLLSAGAADAGNTKVDLTIEADGLLAQIPDTVLHNTYYVDGINGSDITGDGSISKPYATVGQAATTIGAASSNADFNDATKRYYLVNVAPGLYIESPTFGTRPFILLNLETATIQGTLTVQIDQGTINGAGLQQPSFVVKGPDARGTAGGAATSGITGSLVYESINTGSSLVAQLHVRNIAITSDITKQKTGAAGGYTLSLFIEGSIVQGTIQETTGDSGLTLYADNCNDSSSNSLGAVSGSVNLNVINDVRFNGAVVTTSASHGRWFNTEFKSGQAHDFTGFSGTCSADANSYSSFQNNVPTKGTGTFTLLDEAQGVRYTVATAGNWDTVPVKVNTALDTLAISGIAKTQTANTVLAGPTAGGAALPTFRALVAADMPSLSGSYWTLGGNAVASAQNLGTTSNFDLPIITNNAEVVRITTGGQLQVHATSNQVRLGTTNTVTISSTAPSASRTYTLPDAGANANFILSESAQTINGITTFGATPLFKTALDLEDPGVGTNKVTIQSPTLASSYTLTLPDDDGLANQVLSTDGSGVLSWETINNPTDIQETLYTNATDIVTDENITGFAFSNASVRSFEALVSVVIDATADLFATYKLYGIQRGADWNMTSEYVGDITNVVFSITAAGQIRYTKTTTAGHTLTSIKFRAETLSI